MVMEYVAGQTLDRVIPPGGLPTNLAIKYAVQIAEALARAHAAGIVHRDLKPANIMVDDSGLVKVLDFGLAKLAAPASAMSDEGATMATSSTTPGMIVGTLAYMSPEQAEGKPIDARSDVFSFGSVLYEMLTGNKAFDGQSSAALLAAVMRDDPEAGERTQARCSARSAPHRHPLLEKGLRRRATPQAPNWRTISRAVATCCFPSPAHRLARRELSERRNVPGCCCHCWRWSSFLLEEWDGW